jgi:hypothetical protein
VFKDEIELLDLIKHFKARYPVATGFTELYMYAKVKDLPFQL